MHEFTNNFPEYGVLGNPDGPGPIELDLYSADRGYSRKLGFREGAFSEIVRRFDSQKPMFCAGVPLVGAPVPFV